MIKKDITKLNELEAELKEVTAWLNGHKVVYTREDAELKDFKNKQSLELQAVLSPLRLQHRTYLKEEKEAKRIEEAQKKAKSGLSELEALRDTLMAFDVVHLAYKDVMLTEIIAGLKRRYKVLGIKG